MTVEPGPSRRRVLTAGAAGAGALVLAGCSSGGTKAPAAAPTAGARGAPLAKLSDIPVGGAVAAQVDGKPVIVSQPVAGRVVGFSAICTHMGCTVAPAGKELHCPCHGSVYDAATGAVKGGPAPRPLPKIAVHVTAGEVLSGA